MLSKVLRDFFVFLHNFWKMGLQMMVVELLIDRDGELDYLYYDLESFSGLNSGAEMIGFRVIRTMGLVTWN